MSEFAVISGTPSEGFVIIGPFPHPAIAAEWAATWEQDVDYWVTEMISPADREAKVHGTF